MENKLEDLEFIDFDTSLTLSETTFDTIELNQPISKPAVKLYYVTPYTDSLKAEKAEVDIVLDLPKATQLREWLNQFIEKHSREAIAD